MWHWFMDRKTQLKQNQEARERNMNTEKYDAWQSWHCIPVRMYQAINISETWGNTDLTSHDPEKSISCESETLMWYKGNLKNSETNLGKLLLWYQGREEKF